MACLSAVHARDGILRLTNIPPAVQRHLFAAGLFGLLDGNGGGEKASAQPTSLSPERV
ncbi:hypothetical protein [Micromonospora sp. WMMD1219]|uniref:hypothetical protein n=1 Tax=Micromonospora sp. WMMD1219 TaxID=3404115 RepID=UPI003BF52A94